MIKDDLEMVHGEPSYRLGSDRVTLYLTRRGGHMAPVEFDLGGGRTVSPYSLSPWMPDEVDSDLPALLKVLRGDFFCLPFGPTTIGPPHGETANCDWNLIRGDGDVESALRLSIDAADIGGRVEKRITLKPGQAAVYQEHLVSGVEGAFSVGHHPIIDFGQAQGRVTTSAFRYGSVNEGLFSNPENREYQALRPGGSFTDLHSVPMISGETADLTKYPARRGFEDLVMMTSASDVKLGWTATVLDGYVWFALKNPEVFPSTLFWITNGGRHAGPWSGNHVNRLGLEEVCSYFAHGLETSREDRLASECVPTTLQFHKDETKSLRMIHAVAAVRDDFGEVVSIEGISGEESVSILGSGGARMTVPVDWQFALH